MMVDQFVKLEKQMENLTLHDRNKQFVKVNANCWYLFFFLYSDTTNSVACVMESNDFDSHLEMRNQLRK